MNRPLDVTEWLEALRIGPDTVAADFAGELLGRVDRTDDLEAYDSLVEDLEQAAGQKFDEPWRMVEFFTDRHRLLVEIEDRLDKAGFQGDPDDALGNLLGELDELRDQVEELQAAVEVLEREAKETQTGSDLL